MIIMIFYGIFGIAEIYISVLALFSYSVGSCLCVEDNSLVKNVEADKKVTTSIFTNFEVHKASAKLLPSLVEDASLHTDCGDDELPSR